MNGKPRYVFYSVEFARSGTTGPFGPFEAKDYTAAHTIASARAQLANLTLDRIETTSPHMFQPGPIDFCAICMRDEGAPIHA